MPAFHRLLLYGRSWGPKALEGAETLHNRKESKHFTTVLYGVAVGVCVVVGVARLLLKV